MRIGLFLLTAALGGFAGFAGHFIGGFRFGQNPPTGANTLSSPMPHFVPKYEGGASLRYAMVHDVIHERYPVRGPAYYRERDRRGREKLKALPPDSPEAFDLMDDLGVGLDKLGRPADGVPILRDKLVRQEKAGVTGRELYTSYANLGTFLVHSNMKAALTGDAAAKDRVKEGLEFLKKSIEANPQAHFGREQWQVVIVEYLLSSADDPALLTTFDCVGNRFARTPNPSDQKALSDGYAWMGGGRFADAFTPDGTLKNAEDRPVVRDLIRKVGDERSDRSYPDRGVPFDEPALGIIGMWRQGGGANPYFAVALGEIMLRVGQRHIAWTAYERASVLADKYGWKPEHAEFLRKHGKQRQQEIEGKLEPDEVRKLRPQFEAELAYGQKFQREYQQYEADKIAAGADPHDGHFFDAFYTGREPIATPVGEAEWFARADPAVIGPLRTRAAVSAGLLSAGIVAFATAAIGRIVGWWRRPKASVDA